MAGIIKAFFRLRHPSFRIEQLGPPHVEAAASLLSQEFCEREPLCRQLGMNLGEIQPFFRGLVEKVAESGLGAVTLDRQNQLLGVVTIEDHFDLYEPNGELSEGLATIGSYLDQLKLPSEWVPRQRGEIYHCGLAAVARKVKNSPVLLMMILHQYPYLKARGYRGGYAKVTNRAIVKRFRKLEKLLRGDHFKCLLTAKPAEFEYKGNYPFSRYPGASYMFAWLMP